MSIESEKTSTAWPSLDQAQPRTEARSLAVLVKNGSETVAGVRELISVGKRDMFILEAMAAERPELTSRIQSSLNYRSRVRQEFDKIVEKQR